jgi:hypothetical protein
MNALSNIGRNKKVPRKSLPITFKNCSLSPSPEPQQFNEILTGFITPLVMSTTTDALQTKLHTTTKIKITFLTKLVRLVKHIAKSLQLL